MSHGRYKLLRQAEGIGWYSDGAVKVEPGNGTVIIAPNAFDWLKDEYGPNALLPREDDEFVKGALKGAKYALNECSDGSIYNVTIESIRFTIADSTEDTVAFASCRAVWHALKVEPKSKPYIEKRKIHW